MLTIIIKFLKMDTPTTYTTSKTVELRINERFLYRNVNWDLFLDLEQNGYVLKDQKIRSFYADEIEDPEAREPILRTLGTILGEIKPTKWFRLNQLEKLITKKINEDGVTITLYGDTDRINFLFYIDSVESDQILYGAFIVNDSTIKHTIIGVSDGRLFIDSTYFHYVGDNRSGANKKIRLNEISAKNIREHLQNNFVEYLPTK